MTQFPPQPPPQFPPGYPGMMPPGGLSMKPHRATTVLVLGIISLVCCWICGIFAWTMGNADLKEMDAGLMDPSGRSQTNAGKICGMIGTILGVSVTAVYLILILIGIVSGSHHAVRMHGM